MYSAEVNRAQPACLLLLIDQSYSMSEPWADADGSKAQALAIAVNRILGTAVVLCSKGDDRVLDYFEVGVLGYGSDVVSALDGTSEDKPLLPVSVLANNPKRVDVLSRKTPDGAGGVVEVPFHMPIWVDPAYSGQTSMVTALEAAERAISEWCQRNPRSFPPIVINVTDGVSTDGDPREVADRIRAVTTEDGAALLFNLHLSARAGGEVSFPSEAAGLPDAHAASLFHMSSTLPMSMAEAASALRHPIRPGARGFLYNADATTVIEFLDIGTRAVTPGGLKEITSGR